MNGRTPPRGEHTYFSARASSPFWKRFTDARRRGTDLADAAAAQARARRVVRRMIAGVCGVERARHQVEDDPRS